MNNYEYYTLIPQKTKKELRDWFECGLNKGMTKEGLIFEICQEYDLYFDYITAKNSKDLGHYIKNIVSLKQNENKKFSDSLVVNGVINASSVIMSNEGVSFQVGKFKIEQVEINLLSELKNEQRLLLDKIRESREEGNIGTYKNLIQALRDITYLIQGEQCRIKSEKLYVEVGMDISYIYHNAMIYSFKGTNHNDFMIDKVKSLLRGNESVPIYLDTRGIGLCVHDKLKVEGYNVISVKTECQKCY